MSRETDNKRLVLLAALEAGKKQGEVELSKKTDAEIDDLYQAVSEGGIEFAVALSLPTGRELIDA